MRFDGGSAVDATNTLPPGDRATVGVSFDGTDVHFSFGIPRGSDGSDGATGADGPPGEVSAADLAAAIAGASANSNAVAMLGMTVSDPPTQAEMQAVVDKLDEALAALRR